MRGLSGVVGVLFLDMSMYLHLLNRWIESKKVLGGPLLNCCYIILDRLKVTWVVYWPVQTHIIGKDHLSMTAFMRQGDGSYPINIYIMYIDEKEKS